MIMNSYFTTRYFRSNENISEFERFCDYLISLYLRIQANIRRLSKYDCFRLFNMTLLLVKKEYSDRFIENGYGGSELGD